MKGFKGSYNKFMKEEVQFTKIETINGKHHAMTIAGTMASHANRYIKLIGKTLMFTFSPTTVIKRPRIIVNSRETRPTCRSCTMDKDWANFISATLVVTKNDAKLHNGTVITARMGGNFLIMARGCLKST